MENHKSFGGRIGLLCLSLGVFFLFQNVDALNKTHPTANVNLSPYISVISAYYCLNKTVPSNCSPKGQLTDKGILNVSLEEVGNYCSMESGCSKHALDVLKCVYLCRRDFSFANNATVPILNQTIIEGCKSQSSAISNVDQKYKSSGIKLSQKMYIPLVTGISTLAFAAIFNNM